MSDSARRYIALETITALSDDPAVCLSAIAS
jgi:hypothetical protein